MCGFTLPCAQPVVRSICADGGDLGRVRLPEGDGGPRDEFPSFALARLFFRTARRNRGRDGGGCAGSEIAVAALGPAGVAGSGFECRSSLSTFAALDGRCCSLSSEPSRFLLREVEPAWRRKVCQRAARRPSAENTCRLLAYSSWRRFLRAIACALSTCWAPSTFAHFDALSTESGSASRGRFGRGLVSSISRQVAHQFLKHGGGLRARTGFASWWWVG